MPGRDQPVVEDHVGGVDQLARPHGQQPRIARARRRRGRRSRRQPPRAAGRRRRRRAGGAASSSPEAASSSSQDEPSGRPTKPRTRPPQRRARRPACGRWPRARGRRGAPRRARRGSTRGRRRRAASAAGLPVRAWMAITPWPAAGTKTPPVQHRARLAAAVQAVQPGRREHEHVDLARDALGQPRVDVAAQLADLEVRPGGEQLRAAAQRARPDPRALAHRSQRVLADQHVERLRPPRRGRDHRARPRARPGRPWPSGRRGRSRPPAARTPARRPSATCRRGRDRRRPRS